MPRPKKCRKVCQMPQIREFHPLGRACGDPAVILTVDEYEAIRLIDRQGDYYDRSHIPYDPADFPAYEEE